MSISGPIPPTPPIPQGGGQGPDVTAVAKQMQGQVGQLTDCVKELSTDNSQASNTEFLQKVANVVSSLKETVEKALNLGRKI